MQILRSDTARVGLRSDTRTATIARVQVLIRSLCVVLLTIAPCVAHAQPADDADHAIVYEVGWAADWSRDEGLHPKGGTFAFELPISERWLEIEFGVEAIHADGTEIGWDVLFKKPWTLSRTVEFMAGAGPTLSHSAGSDGGTFWGLSAVADLMVWPKRNIGWYLEPGYELTFHGGEQRHGLSFAAGLLIGR